MNKQEFRKELDKYLAKYEKIVNNAGLADNTINTYLLHSCNFVRWVNNDFIPGATLKKKK